MESLMRMVGVVKVKGIGLETFVLVGFSDV